ncbi:hypothetical protein TRICI_001618 [Trichomonascus ciferrii]|uniref:Uncharacterized protein n=1 Tax=Trichomonascus ciferrii TaxID=44093 RepID=A0A642V8T5_9ASCO|nr:hypothetical protein TRICI_001618 [Trichomonascus ciferrii]
MAVCTGNIRAQQRLEEFQKREVRIQINEFQKKQEEQPQRTGQNKKSALSALLKSPPKVAPSASQTEERGRSCLKFCCPSRPDKDADATARRPVKRRPFTPPPANRLPIESDSSDEEDVGDWDDMDDNLNVLVHDMDV